MIFHRCLYLKQVRWVSRPVKINGTSCFVLFSMYDFTSKVDFFNYWKIILIILKEVYIYQLWCQCFIGLQQIFFQKQENDWIYITEKKSEDRQQRIYLNEIVSYSIEIRRTLMESIYTTALRERENDELVGSFASHQVLSAEVTLVMIQSRCEWSG